MPSQFRQYNPKAAKVTFNFKALEDGLADGDFIDVARVSEVYDDVAGASGTVSRARMNDERHEITLTFLQNSIENKFLQDRLNADLESVNGLPPVPFYYRDAISGDEIFAAEAWLKNRDSFTRGKTTNSQSWTIMCVKARVKYGVA